MLESTMLEIYSLIKLNLSNPNSIAYSICEELLRKHPCLERDDLIHELFVRFLLRHHKGINNLPAYVCVFCRNELMNLKRYYVYRETESLDYFLDKNPDFL